MSRFATLAYTLIAYGAFNAWFLYMIAFLNEWPVPKTINSGQVGPPGVAIAINVGLMALFVLQHTIMARPAFKQRVFGTTNRAEDAPVLYSFRRSCSACSSGCGVRCQA